MALDIHVYYAWGFGTPTVDQQENLQRAKNAVSMMSWPVIVGEWSLASNGHDSLQWEPAKRDSFLRSFARLQLQAWETHATGWFYWSYRVRFRNSTWSFKDMCEVGWLPGCVPGFEYGPAEWWTVPPCTFAYLDGGCDGLAAIADAMSSKPALLPILKWILIVAMCAILGGMFHVVRLLRPDWAKKVADHIEALRERDWQAFSATVTLQRMQLRRALREM